MKKFVIFCFFLSWAVSIKSQTDQKIIPQRRSMHVSNVPVASKYAGLEDDISPKLISGKIPGDFPTVNNNESLSAYQDRITKWVQANQFLVKSEYRSEFFTKAIETTK
jgi:hypothetical protein